MRLTFDFDALDQSSTVSSSGRSSERSAVGRARCSLPPTKTLVEVLSPEARSEVTRTEGQPRLACSTRPDGVRPDPPADHYLDLGPRSQMSDFPSRPPFFLVFMHIHKSRINFRSVCLTQVPMALSIFYGLSLFFPTVSPSRRASLFHRHPLNHLFVYSGSFLLSLLSGLT